MKLRDILLGICLLLGGAPLTASAVDEVIITFEDAEVGKPIESWAAKDVTFEPAEKLKLSKAAPRIMFFPHLKTEKNGILSAMAAEAIPVQIRFPMGASKVTLVLWGSIGSAAVVEALNKNGEVVDKASLDKVPARMAPADAIPSFELTVKAPEIFSVRFTGAHPGGYIAAEQVRFTPLARDSRSDAR
jgi:hypothetical protein